MWDRRKKNIMFNMGPSIIMSGEEIKDLQSLDLAFNLTKERIEFQFEQVNALDTKANFILGSSTAFVSAALVLQAVIYPAHISLASDKLLQLLPILILLATFLAVLLSAFFAYNIRNYKRAPNPNELLDNYVQKPEYQTKAELFSTMVIAYNKNEKAIKKKVLWTKLAFIFLECEALALVIFLMFHILQ